MANGNDLVFLPFCGLDSIISTATFTVSKERWLLIRSIQGFQSVIMYVNLSHPFILIYLHAFFFWSFYIELAREYLLYRAVHINFARIPQIMCITSKDLVLG